MYSLSVQSSDWNRAFTDRLGQTTELGRTAADKETGQEEGSAAMDCVIFCKVTCFMGGTEEEEEDEEEEEEEEEEEGEEEEVGKEESGDEGGVMSGKEVQLQL
jgi:hypothetical protein